MLLFLPLWILIITRRKNKKEYLAAKIMKKKGDNLFMFEFAKTLIGKKCIIYTFNDAQITGVIKEVSESALLVASDSNTDIINLDFVIRIREYPRGKNGKEKSVVIG